MILRRVIERVKAQNWFAVAIDFVIVVVGVFIDLQVNNWNEAQGEREREATYLTQLVEDMSGDLADIDRVANTASRRMAVIALVLHRASISVAGNRAVVVDGGDQPTQGPGRSEAAEFDLDGRILARFGRFGNYDGQFRLAHDVVIASDGSVLVADAWVKESKNSNVALVDRRIQTAANA